MFVKFEKNKDKKLELHENFWAPEVEMNICLNLFKQWYHHTNHSHEGMIDCSQTIKWSEK